MIDKLRSLLNIMTRHDVATTPYTNMYQAHTASHWMNTR